MSKKYPAYSVESFKHFFNNKERNGFESCIVMTGRKRGIIEIAFLKWLKKQNNKCDLVTDEAELNMLGSEFSGKYCTYCYRTCGCK